MRFLPMSEEDAKEVCSWKYDGEYSVYDYPEWEKIKNLWAIGIKESREREFYSVYEAGKLIGHFRVVDFINYHVLGLGFKPEYCGNGRGAFYIGKIIDFLEEQGVEIIRLDVRTFNERAIKCYERNGFVKITVTTRKTETGDCEFYVMERRI